MYTGLEIDSILKSFGERTILADVYLECCRGDIIALFGRNGTGKSTLLNIIFGTLKADRKFIRIDGKVITASLLSLTSESVTDSRTLYRSGRQETLFRRPNTISHPDLPYLWNINRRTTLPGNQNHPFQSGPLYPAGRTFQRRLARCCRTDTQTDDRKRPKPRNHSDRPQFQGSTQNSEPNHSARRLLPERDKKQRRVNTLWLLSAIKKGHPSGYPQHWKTSFYSIPYFCIAYLPKTSR